MQNAFYSLKSNWIEYPSIVLQMIEITCSQTIGENKQICVSNRHQYFTHAPSLVTYYLS